MQAQIVGFLPGHESLEDLTESIQAVLYKNEADAEYESDAGPKRVSVSINIEQDTRINKQS